MTPSIACEGSTRIRWSLTNSSSIFASCRTRRSTSPGTNAPYVNQISHSFQHQQLAVHSAGGAGLYTHRHRSRSIASGPQRDRLQIRSPYGLRHPGRRPRPRPIPRPRPRRGFRTSLTSRSLSVACSLDNSEPNAGALHLEHPQWVVVQRRQQRLAIS